MPIIPSPNVKPPPPLIFNTPITWYSNILGAFNIRGGGGFIFGGGDYGKIRIPFIPFIHTSISNDNLRRRQKCTLLAHIF